MSDVLRQMFPNSPQMFGNKEPEPVPAGVQARRRELRAMFPHSYNAMAGRVVVVMPDGQLNTLPHDQVAEAVRRGLCRRPDDRRAK